MEATINSGDTAWVLASAALVLLMTPGLAFFYGGLVRGKNVLNTMMMSIIAMGVVAIQWALFGYSFAFGDGGAFIGTTEYVGLQGVGAAVQDGTAIPQYAFMVFQMMFAVITPALISGAVVERMKFSAYAFFIVAWAAFVYDPLCHWVWGGGWIADLGALDFAGGTVVHISAGVSALVAALILGKRKGIESDEVRPHNVPFVILGAALLWFGWFGFNAGSALAADGIAALAFVTTNLAAAAAMVTWVVLERTTERRPSAAGAAIGAVVGLVTITPAAGFVTPMGAIAMGFIGALVAFGAVKVFRRSRIDDSLDVFACHGVGGIVGSLLTGIFATTTVNAGGADGLLYGGGLGLLGVQALSVVAAMVYAGALTAGILYGLKFTIGIRVRDAHEDSGLDLGDHGEEAYVVDTPNLVPLRGGQEKVEEAA